MNAVFSGIIAAGWACNAGSLPTFHLDQAGYSEIEPVGRTPAEARDRLLHFLIRAIESACQVPRRPPLRLALVDLGAVDPRFRNRA
jgi:hypothetical protein